MAFVWNHYSPIHLLLDGILVVMVLVALAGAVRLLRVDAASPSRRVLAALLIAATAVFVPVAVVVFGVGFRGAYFFLARALWIVPTVAVPAAAVVLRCRFGVRRRWLLLLVALPLALKLYGEAIEPRRLQVEQITLPLGGLVSEVRVVHLSDLQTDGIGAMHLRARAAANRFRPHLLAFTGDAVNHPSLVPEVAAYLRGFERQHAFFVSGNVDPAAQVRELCRDSGMVLLDGRAVVVTVAGSELAVLGQAQWRWVDRELLARLVAETGGVRPRLLLSHLPGTLRIARDEPIDLLLAGHSHGGQVVIPGFGPPVTFTSVRREIAAGGLHRVGDLHVLVSRGLGWEGHYAPRVRLFCRPHLVLLTLVPAAAPP